MTVFIIFILVGIALFYFGRKQENRLMRIFGISLFALGLLLLIAKWAGWISSEDGINVQTTKVQKRTIVQTVSASGKIQPEVEVKISPDVYGEIVQLYIMEGDQVEKGDLLLKIKPDTYQSILERSQAALNTSKSALAKAKAQLIESEANFNRNKSLYDNGTISKSEFEKIKRLLKINFPTEEIFLIEDFEKVSSFIQNTLNPVQKPYFNILKISKNILELKVTNTQILPIQITGINLGDKSLNLQSNLFINGFDLSKKDFQKTFKIDCLTLECNKINLDKNNLVKEFKQYDEKDIAKLEIAEDAVLHNDNKFMLIIKEMIGNLQKQNLQN